jgi:hypothetical protein
MSTPNPLVIFSSGQRTGSTLLQRFLLSNPRIMIWGEHDGVLSDIYRRFDRLYEWESMFGHQLETFMDYGYNTFIPNMVPPPDVIANSQRAMLEVLYKQTAQQMGRDIWGFKEVLYDANMAVRLRELFPGMRVLYITRHPFDCFVSLLHEERLKPHEVNIPIQETWMRPKTVKWLQYWTKINESFLNHPAINDDWVLRLTYETLTGDMYTTTAHIAKWLGLPLSDFDRDVFQHRRFTDRDNPHRGNGHQPEQEERRHITWDDLSAEEYLLITQPDLRRTAERLGYAMPDLLFQQEQ